MDAQYKSRVEELIEALATKELKFDWSKDERRHDATEVVRPEPNTVGLPYPPR